MDSNLDVAIGERSHGERIVNFGRRRIVD